MKRNIFNGLRFGRLTVIDTYVSKQGHNWKHLVRCDCGNTKHVLGLSLQKGETKSCGCLSLELSENLNRSHGMSKSPTYSTWLAMHKRCKNPKASNYKYYGERGISVCDRWSVFTNFLEDMGERPGQDWSIDRLDPNGNYEPSNCRWVTISENSHKRWSDVKNS